MSSLRVVIAGGGVAALEAMLALRASGAATEIELIAPGAEYVHRPLLVAEPFGVAEAPRLDLAELAAAHDASLRRDSLAGLEPGERRVLTGAGERLAYDALLIAIGARPAARVEGALTFSGAAERERFGSLLAALAERGTGSLAIVVPPGSHWSLPGYELALLSAAFLRERGAGSVAVSLLTPERQPFELLGRGSAELLASTLAAGGVELRCGARACRAGGGRVELEAGEELAADHVLALPALEVPPLAGVPQRSGGFIPTDARLHVEGLEDVWAAGDVTWFPIKQGGLAAQQADVAAAGIAARAGAHAPAEAFRPVLRAALLTGALPLFFRAPLAAGEPATVSPTALWSAAGKLAGRHLGPLVASRTGVAPGSTPLPLVDLEPASGQAIGGVDAREAAATLDFALAAADADAEAGDPAGALEWLGLVEEMAFAVPAGYARRRDRWRQAVAAAPANGDA